MQSFGTLTLVNTTSSVMSCKQHDSSKAMSSKCGLRTITVVEFTCQAYQLLVTRFSNCPTIDEFHQGLLNLSDASPAYQIQGT
jgi:hypothetical protein